MLTIDDLPVELLLLIIDYLDEQNTTKMILSNMKCKLGQIVDQEIRNCTYKLITQGFIVKSKYKNTIQKILYTIKPINLFLIYDVLRYLIEPETTLIKSNGYCTYINKITKFLRIEKNVDYYKSYESMANTKTYILYKNDNLDISVLNTIFECIQINGLDFSFNSSKQNKVNIKIFEDMYDCEYWHFETKEQIKC